MHCVQLRHMQLTLTPYLQYVFTLFIYLPSVTAFVDQRPVDRKWFNFCKYLFIAMLTFLFSTALLLVYVFHYRYRLITAIYVSD